eukprot:12212257-Karenia_brevis.AAC.1
MNVIPSNHVQHVIQGDMEALPTDSQWRCIILRDGEYIRWSSADLKCCFYVFRLPVAWRPYLAFERPVERSVIGLEGPGTIHLCSAVAPMGWISATGVIQHLHRNLLRRERNNLERLPLDAEVRRDLPFPCRPAAGGGERKPWAVWQVYIDNFDLLEIGP